MIKITAIMLEMYFGISLKGFKYEQRNTAGQKNNNSF